MYFCPFAQRVRLVLAHKNIPHEVVNVDLKYKPDWFLEKNPAGLVPILEQDDKIIVESAICIDFLDEQYPENQLYPKDPYEKAQAKMKMDSFGKAISAYYGLLLGAEENWDENLNKLCNELEALDKIISGKFLMGDTLTMADYYIWPWVERACLIKYHTGQEFMDAEKLPSLHTWNRTMRENPVVRSMLLSDEEHMRFLLSYRASSPEYNFLVENRVNLD